MSITATALIAAFIGYPVWQYYKAKTAANLDRIVVPATNRRTRKVKGPKPPPDHLPPLVGNVVERKVARRLLP